MVRKASRRPSRASGAVTPVSSSSPRSNAGLGSSQRRSSRVAELQSTNRRASLLYQVYDPSVGSAAAAGGGGAPSPTHAAVAAAAAVLANPNGQPQQQQQQQPHPPSPSSSSAHHATRRPSNATGAAAAGGTVVRRRLSSKLSLGSATIKKDRQSAQPPQQHRERSPRPSSGGASSEGLLPRPIAKGGSYANENPRLIVSEPLRTTASSSSSTAAAAAAAGPSSTASPSSATLRGYGGSNWKSNDARKGSNSKKRNMAGGDRGHPPDVSQLSSESGASSAPTSTINGRPRAVSLPRTRDDGAELLPRLQPLRPSPPPPLPPTVAAMPGTPSPAVGVAGSHDGGSAEATPGRAEVREVLSAPPDVFKELTTSTSPRQALSGRRGRGQGESARETTQRRGRDDKAEAENHDQQQQPGGRAAVDGEVDKYRVPTSSGGGGGGAFMRSVKLKHGAVRATHHAQTSTRDANSKDDHANRNDEDGDDDDDDDNWGDAEREGDHSPDHLFDSTQLLASLRQNIKRDTEPEAIGSGLHSPPPPPPLPAAPSSGTSSSSSFPSQRQAAVSGANRSHPTPPPPAAAAAAAVAADASPAYKFNVVLSSGKTATTPVSLVAGSGCVQGMRPTMEDAHFTQLHAAHVRGQPVSIMAVLDGHCGRRVADLGAKWLPHYVLNHPALGENNALALVEAILQTDREIFHTLQAKKAELEQQRKSGRSGGGNGRRRRDMYEEMFDDTSGANGGSTLIIAAVYGRMLYVACLGDARAVLYDGQTTIAMSEDHKPGNADESRRIAKCGGFVQFGRVCGILAVSRALGDFEFKFQPNSAGAGEEGLLTDFPFGGQQRAAGEKTSPGATPPPPPPSSSSSPSTAPSSQSNRRFISNRDLMVSNVADVRQLHLTDASAFLLLACDGLWDVLSNEEATEFVRDFLSYTPDVCDPRILSGEKPRPSPEVIKRVLNNCCQKLSEFAVDRGSMDNVSAMVLFFHDVVDTVARFNGRMPPSTRESHGGGGGSSSVHSNDNSTSRTSGTSGRSRQHGRGSVQSSSASGFELTNNQLKVRNGRIVARR